MCEREKLLHRKASLGRDASYPKLAARIGKSHTTVRLALTGLASDIPMDRAGILRDVARALAEIEAERARPVPYAAAWSPPLSRPANARRKESGVRRTNHQWELEL